MVSSFFLFQIIFNVFALCILFLNESSCILLATDLM
uniref:Uncharacterized protein n=1 Tax=Anguilla anguilla TaxID=7936 RepID=A0A0E9PLZ9_ANGAN